MDNCSVVICTLPAKHRGYCNAHYYRWLKFGDAGTEPVRTWNRLGMVCSVDECDRRPQARGLCAAHYYRLVTTGEIGGPITGPGPTKCVVDGCDRDTCGQGLCRMHYERRRRGNPVGGAAATKRPAGTGCIAPSGYKMVTVESGTAPRLEHRVLMEALLGRPLGKKETVHHVNGDRSDNRITDELDERFRSGNLELWSTWQPAGQRVVDKIDFAHELLQKYAPHLLALSDQQHADAT